MAATGFTPVYIYYSSTTTNVPAAGNLGYGELAINITDGYLFYKDNANAVQKIGYKLVPIANGGTNATSFNAPASSINGLVWFDGTRLVNDATTSHVGYNASTNTFYANNANVSGTLTVGSNTVSGAVPQITVYTSGTGTYTTPSGAKYLIVQMVGAGAGGSGGGTSGGAGGNGGNSTFGSSLTANGGNGSSTPASGDGGTATGGDVNINGGAGIQGFDGRTTSLYCPGGTGGSSFFGGGGIGGYVTTGGTGNAYGSGGGGGGISAAQFTGAGGGAGGYLSKLITSPSATYSYAIGSGGTAGTAGTSGYNGGVGKGGLIIVMAYF